MAQSKTIDELASRTDAELLAAIANMVVSQGGVPYKTPIDQLGRVTLGRMQLQIASVGEQRFLEYKDVASVAWTRLMSDLRGATGPTGSTGGVGATPNLTVGTVTTGAANVTISGTAANPVLNFVIPAATVGTDSVGTTAIQNGAVTTPKIADNNVTGGKLATLVVGDAPKLQAPVRVVNEAVFVIAANTASPSLDEANGRMQTLTSNTNVTAGLTALSDGNMILLRVIASAAITVNVPASSSTVKRNAANITLANGEWVDISVTRMGTNYSWNIGGKLS